MNIHEYQAKELLRKFNVRTAVGKVALSPEQAVVSYRNLGSEKCVVKAQVHAGGRGKGGGIRFCQNDGEVAKAANDLLGSYLVTPQTDKKGQKVEKIYIEEASNIDRELYLAFVIDRAQEQIVAVASSEGGMDIEELAATNPESIIRLSIDPAIGLLDFQARELAFALGLKGEAIRQAVMTFMGCYQALLEFDANLIEINPLVVTSDNKLIALDAKVDIDDNALFRHPEITEMRDKSQEDIRETRAADHDLSYVGLNGNIGCMINGAGLAMATMDMIKYAGGEPANFLDIGGGASPERVAKAFELVLEDTSVKALLVNIYAGINRCDWIAEGVISAFKKLDVKVPLIVRLAGTNVEEGRKMLTDSKLAIITAETLAEAATKAVQAVKN
ncbi:MAG: malate--CoA ligase subunit beta [Candidatus Oxydemutatoraceae bacterium WSBS_2016_MAG_OTU14]